MWAAGNVVAGLLPTDAGGIPSTTSGVLHGVGAGGAFTSLPIAAVLISWRLRLQGARRARALALLTVVTSVAFFASAGSPATGITERAFALSAVAWLTSVTVTAEGRA